jgi:4-hydroxybenzoate polyprenyltransferase
MIFRIFHQKWSIKIMNNVKKKNRWLTFINERFSFLQHIVLLTFLFLANLFVALNVTNVAFNIKSLIVLVIIYLTFFRLRIFDEIKDYKNDLIFHPDRPLARGLIDVNEAKKVAFSLMGIEIFLSSFLGFSALVGIVIVSLYSLLMYKEFFIGFWLRNKLTTYALFHTLVSSLISYFIFSSITKIYIWDIPREYLLFGIANWMIFNVFEFGRKTFAKAEEKKDVPSYSKIFGSYGAAFLVLFMALISIIIAFYLSLKLFWPTLILILLFNLFLFLTIFSLIYAKSNTLKWANKFRFACSIYILFYNLIISLGLIL